ncbi:MULTISPECIES: helix-turn-helix domain-containing protein [Lactobacillaceae]|uniref:helix-turn-helix domain-containing protein n=1 Tax=Lactobacillaceae TaxID=33958 RepID=UPI001456A4DC|nr:helix-turn-helix transcriptional regulator [Lactobacillus sp. HBUAS51381]NLR09418.1 helix-turn-helix transcriptional regulator [Lactobacillus sp. HBUAS51381]
MNFAENLKAVRHDQQMTQTDVATTLHVSRKTVSSWETGRSYPDILTLVKLGELYQISLDNLLKEDLVMAAHYQQQERLGQRRWQTIRVTYYLNIALLFLFYSCLILRIQHVWGYIFLLLLLNVWELGSTYQDFAAWRQHGWHLTGVVFLVMILNALLLLTARGVPAPSEFPASPAGTGAAIGYVLSTVVLIGVSVVSGIFAIYGRIPAKSSRKDA